MKWFYKLKRAVRIIIAVVAWLPLFVFAAVVGGSIGDSGENIETWQAFVVVALLAFGVVFTVFAVLARRAETKADRDAKAAARQAATSAAKPAPASAPVFVPAPSPAKRQPLPLEKFPAKVQITAFEKRVDEMTLSAGDDCVIKYENSPVMVSSGGYPMIDALVYKGDKKVGIFHYGKYLRAIYGAVDYPCKIASVEKIDGKYNILIDIDLPFKKDSKLPLITKLNGVTFGERQKALAASVVGDAVVVRHSPSPEYPNTLEVFNSALDASIGVIPSESAEKLLKKYKSGCVFCGVITSLYGGGVGKNFGVDITILYQQ